MHHCNRRAAIHQQSLSEPDGIVQDCSAQSNADSMMKLPNVIQNIKSNTEEIRP